MFITGNWSASKNYNFTSSYLLHCFNFVLLKHFNPVDLYIRCDLLK